VVPLSWVTRGSFVLSPSYDAAAVAIIGGALYGLSSWYRVALPLNSRVVAVLRAIHHPFVGRVRFDMPHGRTTILSAQMETVLLYALH
jgi:hypothetical protein